MKIQSLFFKGLFIVLSTWLAACQTQQATGLQTTHTIVTDTVIKERLVPVAAPEDSARLIALMRCDEHGRVLLTWYEQQVSRNAQLEFSLDSMGRMLAKFRTRQDTVYIEVADTTVTHQEQKQEKETVTIEVEKPLTRWQGYLQTCGMIANLFVLVLVSVWFLRKKS